MCACVRAMLGGCDCARAPHTGPDRSLSLWCAAACCGVLTSFLLCQSNLPYELDASSLNTFGECDMNRQLQTPVLAAHYRVMPGRQQLQEQQQHGNGEAAAGQQETRPQIYPVRSTDDRTFAGFSFNAGFGSGAEMIFYEFAGVNCHLCVLFGVVCRRLVDTSGHLC